MQSYTFTGELEKISIAPARPAELPVNTQRVKFVATPEAWSKAPPKLPPKLFSKRQSVNDGLEAFMYPAPPPNVQRLLRKMQFLIVALLADNIRMPPPRSVGFA